jgi:site-specific DNA recombinase
VLLIEELARHNVETVFIKAPQTATPEDQLLWQFQGMIAGLALQTRSFGQRP